MSEEIPEIEASEERNIDKYMEQLRSNGYTAKYTNVVDDNAGFVAVVYVNGEKHATWESSMTTVDGQQVRSVITPLDEIPSINQKLAEAQAEVLQDVKVTVESVMDSKPVEGYAAEEELEQAVTHLKAAMTDLERAAEGDSHE